MFNFEKLETWQKAIALAELVYELNRNFPGDERFGLTNQMRRAADEQGKMSSGLRRAVLQGA